MKKLTSLFTLLLILLSAGAMNAQQNPTVTVDKQSLSFSAQVGGAASSQSLTITPSGAMTIFATPSASWLKINGQSQAQSLGVTGPVTVTVTADPAGMAAANYPGTITFQGINSVGMASPVVVSVNFAVGLIGVTPSTVAFAYQMNGATPPPTTLTVSASTAISYTATAATTSGGNWLSVQPSGTAPGTLLVSPNLAVIGLSMAAGTYNGTITITPSLGPAVVVPVTLTVTSAPTVTANPSTINLNYQIGGATGSTNTPTATLTLTNPGNQPLSYLITPSSAPLGWLTVDPATGTIPAGGSVTVNVSYPTGTNLPAGSYNNNSLTIYVPGAANTPINVPVKLLVSNLPLLTVPNSTLNYTYQLGGSLPAAQTVVATSSAVAANSTTGQMPLIITATTATGGNWLTVPSTGLTGTNFSISVNPAGLAVGAYNGTVTVQGVGAGNPAQTIPVTLTVSNDPLIVATFGGCSTQTVTCPLNFILQTGQNNPATQTINVASSTGAQASFAATAAVTPSQAGCGTSWLSVGVTAAVISDKAAFPITVTPPATIPSAGLTCTGTITIAGTNAATGVALPNSPVTVPVTMYVSANPMVVPSATALSFSVPLNNSASTGSASVPAFTVTSTSSTNVDFTVSTPSNAPWLLAGPSSRNTAAANNNVIVVANSNGLAPGTYTSALTITSSALDSPLTVPVTMTVTSAAMSVSPSSLSFTQTRGGAAPDAKTLAVSTSSTDIPFTVSVTTQKGSGWLSATASTTTATQANPATVTVRVDGSNLAPDTYQGAVTITSTSPYTSNSPVTIPVTLEVKAGTLSVSPTTLTFAQVQGGAAPPAQNIAVAATPAGANLSYTVTTSVTGNTGNWLSVDTTTGTTPGNVKVSVNGTGLQPGAYNGKVTITSTGATGSPIDVPVSFTVVAPQSLAVSPATVNFNYVIGTTTAPAQQTVQLTTAAGTPFTTNITYSGASGQNWLTVSPTSGTGATGLVLNVNPSGLAAGNYTATIAVNSTSAVSNPAASITVNLTVQAVPKPVFTAVANAASYVNGPVSAGENIVIFGTGLGPAQVTLGHVTNNVFDTTVAETQVLFDNVPAPIIYVSANQTSVMVPYGVAGRPNTSIRIVYKGVQSDPIVYNVVAAQPGIYTANAAGSGQGAILNQDYTYNGPSIPAAKDSIVAVYMTGEGVTSPASPDGAVAPSNGTGLYKPTQTVTATVGGVPAKVEYYGSAPGIIYGVMQVNVHIPADAPTGNLPLVINVGSNATQANVTVAVK